MDTLIAASVQWAELIMERVDCVCGREQTDGTSYDVLRIARDSTEDRWLGSVRGCCSSSVLSSSKLAGLSSFTSAHTSANAGSLRLAVISLRHSIHVSCVILFVL
jgi:hypothetical protein